MTKELDLITYTVDLEHPESHYIDVCLDINSSLDENQQFWLPDWIPGSYMVRDFARNIVSIHAFESTNPIELIKVNKSTWSLSKSVSSLQIKYKVYAWDLSVRSAHFDDQHCFFNGTSLLLAIAGKEEQVHQLKLKAPGAAESNNWSVATTMDVRSIDGRGFGQYQAANYSELVDHPFEIANLDSVDFDVFGVLHKMVFTEAPAKVDYQRIARDVKQICEYECRFFADEKPPFEQYLFMTFVQKKGFGGLEHRSSTALQCSHEDLPLIHEDQNKKSAGYQRFLSLCCHEYFHSWNVKRIKPARFEDYKLQTEVHTELLWFFEGITSYYDELFLVRAGVITPEQYLDMLAKNITRLLRGSGRTQQTIADSSFDAWTKFYKQDENAVNSIVSYYVKGGLIAFELDFEIRRLTSGQKSLDDFMRVIWSQYGKKSLGIEERQIQALAEELTGRSMSAFFDRVLYSTAELELTALFEKLDLQFQLLPEIKNLETGGFIESVAERKKKGSFGTIHEPNELGVKILNVFEASSAANAGLSSGDIIIALDDYRILNKDLDNELARFEIGSEVKISFFRRDKLYQRQCQVQTPKASVCFLSYTERSKSKIFLEWLEQPTQA